MEQFVYTAAVGANRIMQAQAINMNNLANVNTTGFREDLAAYHSVEAETENLGMQVFSVADQARSSFRPGGIETTGRDLDIAVVDEGWLAVQNSEGEEAYTRAGSLKLTPEGMLTTASGAPVLGNGGPISIPGAENMMIADDGTISIQPLGQGAEGIVQMDRLKLVNPPETQLLKGEDGLFYRQDQATSDPDANVKIVSGALEGSNVDSVAALASMLDMAREYEVEVNLMKTAEETSKSSSDIMDIN